jgi:hypothetical protein
MGVKMTGFTELSATLKQGGETVRRAVRERIKKEGPSIARLARKMAPVETGDLEDAIRSVQSYDGDHNGRLMAEVGVMDYGDVGDYAVEMHEGLQPFGDGTYNLGPDSAAKQIGQTEIVGGKFLERALEERSAQFLPEIIADIRKEFD